MKRNSKQFLALFMAVAMSVTPVSYAYAEDSAVAGVENTESGQQTVEVTDGEIGAANAAGQPAEEVGRSCGKCRGSEYAGSEKCYQ